MKKTRQLGLCLWAAALVPSPIMAHAWHAESTEPAVVFDESYRAKLLAQFMEERGHQTLVASTGNGPAALQIAALAVAAAQAAPAQATPFLAFAPKVGVHWDSDFLYIESNGMPAHNMMVGITNWQQQVPLPQAYRGDNGWRLPLHPVVAKQPASIKNRFLRGAIALAVNGIPIFNPQNNRGEVSQEIGELDQWGGHCGRADDYHYHAAPLHLQTIAGKGQPIAYALDGYPIYGLTETDGAPVGQLDDCHGHETGIGYHYHASTTYPYVNGGFHGEVVELGGQVDPQPRATPIRGAGSPLRGAKITGFENTSASSYKLSYEVNGDHRAILYSVKADGTYPFEYQNGSAGTAQETYTKRQGGPREGRRQGPNGVGANEHKAAFVLTSPVVANGGAYPVEFTGDGAGSTPPLAWTGAPEGTKSYALIMHHLDPEGITKGYWTLYNIPSDVTHLDKNTQGIGSLGTSFKGQTGYEPPHSKGPGPKTYVISVYALSVAPPLDITASPVTGDVLSAAIKNHVLASADLSVVYSREGAGKTEVEDKPRRQSEAGPKGGQHKPWLQQHGAELDANHDGVITLTEMADDMNRAFAIYDHNRDGIITAEEIKAAGEVREGAAFAGFIFHHFTDLDTNGDGSVSRHEMADAAKMIFDLADQDHDGRVTAAEWASAPQTPFRRSPSGASPPPQNGLRVSR